MEYEFFGPNIGPIFLMIFLPCFCYYLSSLTSNSICKTRELDKFLSVKAFGIVYCFFLLVAVLHIILPGKNVKGVLLESGKRLTYKINGTYKIEN